MHRLRATLAGHKHELLAVLNRTSAHKLPGAKGRLREDAVGRFLSTWVSSRFAPISNVFVTDPKLGEFKSELDLVLHDSHRGGRWPLDGDNENSIVTWAHVKAVLEIKSTLNERTWIEARESMSRLSEWGGIKPSKRGSSPLRVLFSFRIDRDFVDTYHEACAYKSLEDIPFDAIVLLDGVSMMGRRLEELEVGLRRGLVPSEVDNDGPSQDCLLMREMPSTVPNNFRSCGETPEDGLMALSVLSSLACCGERNTKALLSAFRATNHHPIWVPH